MTDLEQRVHEFFDARARTHAAPDFESMLAHAQSGRSRQRLPWVGAALAATVLAAVVLLRVGHNSVDVPAAAQLIAVPDPAQRVAVPVAHLIADLSTSTHWIAPSDRWLGDYTRIRYPDMSEFARMTYQMEEVKAWL